MKRIEISISSLVKAIIIIVIGLLLVIQTPTFATTGKSTAQNVRVRKSASAESEVIELLGVDDVVEILGKEGDWYKVSFKGTIGYVSQSFISTNEKNSNENSESKLNNNQNEEINNNDNNSNENNSTDVNDSENTDVNNNNTENNDNSTESNSDENVQTETNTQTTVTTRIYKMAETCNVRILPVVTAEQIGEIEKNEKVTLVINAKLWAYIESESISGWVRIDKLSSEDVEVSIGEENNSENNNVKDDNSNNEDNNENNNDKKEEEKQPETITFAPRTMYVGTTAINVRSESNTSSNVVDSLELNSEVKVVGEQNGWYMVEINGKNGFIRKDLLSNNKKEVSSRNNQLDRNVAAQNNNQQQSAQQEGTATIVSTVTESTQVAEAAPVAESAPATESVPLSSSGVSGSDIAAYAQQFVGCRYVYGATGPNSFDCSGLTKYVYAHFGYTLNRTSRDQAVQGVAVTGELQPGDILVFSNNGKNVGHVGIYIGNDKFVHASDSNTGVIISNLSDRWNKSKYWGARRIL